MGLQAAFAALAACPCLALSQRCGSCRLHAQRALPTIVHLSMLPPYVGSAAEGSGIDDGSGEAASTQGCKLFIYSLARTVTDADLAPLFAPFAPIYSCVAIGKKGEGAGANDSWALLEHPRSAGASGLVSESATAAAV